MDLIAFAWIAGAVLVSVLMGYHHLMDGVPLRDQRSQLGERLATRSWGALAVAGSVLAVNLFLVMLTQFPTR